MEEFEFCPECGEDVEDPFELHMHGGVCKVCFDDYGDYPEPDFEEED